MEFILQARERSETSSYKVSPSYREQIRNWGKGVRRQWWRSWGRWEEEYTKVAVQVWTMLHVAP